MISLLVELNAQYGDGQLLPVIAKAREEFGCWDAFLGTFEIGFGDSWYFNVINEVAFMALIEHVFQMGILFIYLFQFNKRLVFIRTGQTIALVTLPSIWCKNSKKLANISTARISLDFIKDSFQRRFSSQSFSLLEVGLCALYAFSLRSGISHIYIMQWKRKETRTRSFMFLCKSNDSWNSLFYQYSRN